MFADDPAPWTRQRKRRTEEDLRGREAPRDLMARLFFGSPAPVDEELVRGADILTLGAAGLVGYWGMPIEEIESYGWIPSVPRRRLSEGPRSAEGPAYRQGLRDAYREYVRRLADRPERYDTTGWDPDDPDPENPWNKGDDDDAE